MPLRKETTAPYPPVQLDARSVCRQRKNSFACLAEQLPLGTRTKRGHASCVMGGSDSTNFLGGWKPKKWGRSRPIWWFFLCHLSLPRVCYFLVFPRLMRFTRRRRWWRRSWST